MKSLTISIAIRKAVNLAGQTLTGFTAGQAAKLSVRAGNTPGIQMARGAVKML